MVVFLFYVNKGKGCSHGHNPYLRLKSLIIYIFYRSYSRAKRIASARVRMLSSYALLALRILSLSSSSQNWSIFSIYRDCVTNRWGPFPTACFRFAHHLDCVKRLLYKNAKVRPSKDALSGRPAITGIRFASHRPLDSARLLNRILHTIH